MSRLVISKDLHIRHHNAEGERLLGQTDFRGISERCGVSLDRARQVCLDELLATWALDPVRAVPGDVIQSYAGTFVVMARPEMRV
jgi:hypothetical protein